jgi:hypothetical protein
MPRNEASVSSFADASFLSMTVHSKSLQTKDPYCRGSCLHEPLFAFKQYISLAHPPVSYHCSNAALYSARLISLHFSYNLQKHLFAKYV